MGEGSGNPAAGNAERVLGYLNFSSGAHDPTMLRQLNDLCHWLETSRPPDQPNGPLHQSLQTVLVEQLQIGTVEGKALRNPEQARMALMLAFEHVLPAYREHHRDLLFHQSADAIFNAFFIGRVFERVLAEQEHWADPAATTRRVIGRLNDYIGHRPLAVLESGKREPYEHEWVRPIPLYIRGAGVVHGPAAEVVQSAIDHLYRTDPEIRRAAQLDPELLDELALDPRSFDFDHPVNKRPNYHFGQWDEHHIDNRGHYRRFVIHNVTLDSLCRRIESESGIPRDQLVCEAGAVLACTILMSSGICGYGPGAHDSTVTLGNLLPLIAAYRDAFYEHLLARIPEDHRQRLAGEIEVRQQPFGAARQHLNQELASYRGMQMMHVHLSRVYARMGYPQSALRHVDALPVASTRMMCQLECLLHAGNRALDEGNLAVACQTLPRLVDLVQRSIECGALIDPWNIIGFDANYNLFQGTENTVRDHRADELIDLMEQIFVFAAGTWIAAEAADEAAISERVQGEFREAVEWWYQFATHEISSVDSVDAHDVFKASRNVARLLGEWNKSGAERGDLEFWAGHASTFDSDRDYVLAINSLIERDDFATSMALLIHWLSHDDLRNRPGGSASFHGLTGNWISRQRYLLDQVEDDDDWHREAGRIWNRLCKFTDYVEANAGDLWQVPQFTLESRHGNPPPADETGEPVEDDSHQDLYRAAYEDMVFRETTNDGFDGSIYEDGDATEEQLQTELDRILEHLKFLDAVVACWGEAALLATEIRQHNGPAEPVRALSPGVGLKTAEWFQQAHRYCVDLGKLIRAIDGFQLPEPDGSVDSLGEYDRQRLFKESLLDHVIHLTVDTSVALRILGAVTRSLDPNANIPDVDADLGEDETGEAGLWMDTLAGVLAGDRDRVRPCLGELVDRLVNLPLLYVPLSRGGDPARIVRLRTRQSMLGQILDCLPRLGMLTETRELIHTALAMERGQTVRQGAVTEFDELFRIGYTSMVDALIQASQPSCAEDPPADREQDRQCDTALFEALETLAETMLMLWLGHSQTLRLSVLEKVRDEPSWESLVGFIDQFGETLFTQQFLSLSNIRAILHQGVDQWLTQLEEEQVEDIGWPIIEKIRAGYPRRDAVRHMTLVLEAVIENFNEFRDYNCTTTQSDNGRLLYIFLDFLRLRCRYDQVCWNLKPVMWAHESLVRHGHVRVARLWRRLLAERVNPEAEKLLEQLAGLQQKYSIRMATVEQRLNERFVHPMHVDRLVAQVGQAMADPSSAESSRAFELIEHYAETLTRQPVGAGLELPGWLAALEAEVDLHLATLHDSGSASALVDYDLPGLAELRDQLDALPRRES